MPDGLANVSEEVPRFEGFETIVGAGAGPSEQVSEEVPRFEGFETRSLLGYPLFSFGNQKKCPDLRGLRLGEFPADCLGSLDQKKCPDLRGLRPGHPGWT